MNKQPSFTLIITVFLVFGASDSVLADSMRTPEGRKSVVLDPFNYDFRYFPYYELSIRSIIRNLEGAGFSVDYYKDENVTIELLKRLDDIDYDVIYINTHGFLDSEGKVLIFTGEKSTPEKEEMYKEDMEQGRIRRFELGGNLLGYYYVTPSFFKWYGNDMRYRDALIFIDSCQSANNTSMAEAFLDLGARSYVGWTATVGIEFGVAMDGKFFKQMSVDGRTVEESVRRIKPDPATKSRMTYFGDGTLTLIHVPRELEGQGLPVWIPIVMLVIVMTVSTGIIRRFIKTRGSLEKNHGKHK